MNLAVFHDGRRESQTDSIFAELNRDGIPGAAGSLNYRIRKFAAGQKAGFLAGFGQQVWLRQRLQNIFLLQVLILLK